MSTEMHKLFPSPSQIDPVQLAAARTRVASYFTQWFEDLDLRPNSVAGDLQVTPIAIFQKMLEHALDRVLSDVRLDNVSKGIVVDEEFVRAFLSNFGLASGSGLASTGIIKLTFNADKLYQFNADSVFTIGNAIFTVGTDEGNPVSINPTGSINVRRILTKEAAGRYVVLLPVTGPVGSVVADGTAATSELTHPELVSITAVGDFDPGSAPESVVDLARLAPQVYPAASFTSRNSALSLLRRNFLNAVGLSVTVSGDREMVRGTATPLGIQQGAVDVFLKSRPNYVYAESVLRLAYSDVDNTWRGLLDIPVVPGFFSLATGVFRVGKFMNSRGVSTIYSQSTHPVVDSLGVAFSRYEKLGIKIVDDSPVDITEGYMLSPTQSSGPSIISIAEGSYTGSLFHSTIERNLTLRLDAATEVDGYPAVVVNVRDNVTGETGKVYVIGNATESPSTGRLDTSSPGYRQFMSGLELTLTPESGSFEPSQLLGALFNWQFRARSAQFNVGYLYDPALIQLDSLVSDADNQPVGVSVWAKSFTPCFISSFTVNYRIRFGKTLDAEAVKTEIFNYLNSIAYPDTYEDSRIGKILLDAGASGVQSVLKRGIFYPSLGFVYVDKEGVESLIEHPVTTTLLPTANDQGYGYRNLTYVVDKSTITLNAFVS